MIAVCIMLRTDSIQYNGDALKVSSSFEGVKLASIVPHTNNYACLRSEDLKVRNLFTLYFLRNIEQFAENEFSFQKTCCFLKSIQFDWKNQNKKLELTEDIDLVWSTNLHLKLLSLYSDIVETCNSIRKYSQSVSSRDHHCSSYEIKFRTEYEFLRKH